MISGAVIAGIAATKPVLWPGGIGFSARESVTTTLETQGTDPQGNPTTTTTETSTETGKTLWDWLDLLGVPFALALLGAWLQKAQQNQADRAATEQHDRDERITLEQRERDERIAKEQRERAADEAREDVLQVYFDRISALLVDKNLMGIAAKGTAISPDQKELLDASLDVIRARTLSILRRFEDDIERKSSVIRFLEEAGIVSKLQLNLKGANLQNANLYWADLNGARLYGCNLSGAKLIGASLQNADLVGADLKNAKLRKADLREAKLYGTKLDGANLEATDLANISFNDRTIWPTPEAVAKAKNIPEELKKKLGI